MDVTAETFERDDVDAEQELAARCGIRGIPTVVTP